ncbi:primosomal protein N' [Parabacteroides sp. OttesenSCG-928-J18]|nr:primosomal protein N' [Parabacteroides sp. OttesenSCG-928-J18]
MKFADVILPLPLEQKYTYRIPPDLEKAVVPGSRVIVHFGRKRYYTAIVLEIHTRQPDSAYETKEIFALLDPTPILRRPQLRFWQWVSSYYLCALGDVYKAALPSGLKLESETAVTYNEDFEADTPLRPNEQSVLDAFAGVVKLTISELERKTGLRNIMPVITSLISKGAVMVNEELKKKFVPKKQAFIRLAADYKEEERLKAAFDELKRAKKQEMLLIAFLELSHALHPTLAKEVSRKELLAYTHSSPTLLDGLIKRGILESYEKEVGRLQASVTRTHPLSALSPKQELAYDAIHQCFKEKDVCLLHGVTSSGKTEIYVHMINDALALGRQVLYLLPEIAITTQITERLARLFGDKLVVYHSKFTDNERVEIWNRLLHNKEPLVVLGVRSSLFLPFHDLGLVIVDEEHEPSYKQQEPAPRYHARNAAMVLAGMHGGKTLLGSATPSIDSYFNATTGKYGLVELTERFGDCRMPDILTADLKELRRKKMMPKESLFSPLLIKQIETALGDGEQAILFQNRRGFAPQIECKDCGWVPHCEHCDVSLTYHKFRNVLICHYCGFTQYAPSECPACKGKDLRMLGFGTEKVEEEVAALFPAANVERLDTDTARTRSAYERILGDFEKGKTQILIGTQMISKGLDFGNVSVVGILNADNLMNFPDFRAHERAFQLMLQVSGRAGRREKQGTVVLQTSQPEHPIIRMVQQNDYKGMVDLQQAERSMFRYPPYYRLIVMVLRSRNEQVLRELSTLYADKLRTYLGERVLGPVTPVITRIQTLHIRQIVLKLEVTAAVAPVRELLAKVHKEMEDQPAFRQLILHYDVDPL